MKRFSIFFILFSFAFLLYPAEPQQEQYYLITESQLQKLETLYQACNSSKQEALKLSSTLLMKAAKLQKGCSNLQTSLQQERQQTASLNQSVSKLENSLEEQQNKYSKIQEENNGLQVKVEKLKRQETALICVLSVLILTLAGYVYLKFKGIGLKLQ